MKKVKCLTGCYLDVPETFEEFVNSKHNSRFGKVRFLSTVEGKMIVITFPNKFKLRFLVDSVEILYNNEYGGEL